MRGTRNRRQWPNKALHRHGAGTPYTQGASAFWIVYVLVLIYAYLALRRVYAESALKAAVKAVVFTAGRIAIYFGAIFVGVSLAFLLA